MFAPHAWNDYKHWKKADTNLLKRLDRLIDECRRHPYEGTGKPEPLKGDLSGWWSRRITSEHRLVYRVAEDGDQQRLEIAQCRYHY